MAKREANEILRKLNTKIVIKKKIIVKIRIRVKKEG